MNSKLHIYGTHTFYFSGENFKLLLNLLKIKPNENRNETVDFNSIVIVP
jgi:hypothetical protein